MARMLPRSSGILAFFAITAPFALASPPDADTAAAAWQRMHEALAGSPTPSSPAAAVAAASAILRLDGRVIGHGAALAGQSTPAVDAAIAEAMRMATSDADWVAWKDRPASLADACTLEMELASEPEPLVGRSLEECAASVRPALDGLAVRRAGTTHWFPASRLQSMGLAANPADGFRILLRRAGLPDKGIGEIDPAEGVAIYRVESTRLANTVPQGTPWPTLHGEKLVPTQAVTRPACVAAALRAIGWLATSTLDEPGDAPPVLLGDYGTISDRREPMVADPVACGLAAWAFAEASAIDPARGGEWRAHAESLLDHAAPSDQSMTAHRAAALRAIAACSLARSASDDTRAAATARRTAARAALLERVKEEGPADGARAVELAAAACLDRDGDPLMPRVGLHGAIAHAWEELPRASLVAEAEWLLRAAEWSGLATPPLPTAQATVRDLIMRSQLGIGSAPRNLPADLFGGVQLTTASGQPSVGIAGVRTLAALAILARTQPDDPASARVVEACRGGARFVMQLQVSPDGAALLRNPRRALDGIREALWEPRVSVAGTAAGALLLLEAANTLPQP